MTYTAHEKLEAVERELRFRRRVYADRVTAKKMTPELAKRQIGIFEEIADDYREKAAGERLL